MSTSLSTVAAGAGASANGAGTSSTGASSGYVSIYTRSETKQNAPCSGRSTSMATFSTSGSSSPSASSSDDGAGGDVARFLDAARVSGRAVARDRGGAGAGALAGGLVVRVVLFITAADAFDFFKATAARSSSTRSAEGCTHLLFFTLQRRQVLQTSTNVFLSRLVSQGASSLMQRSHGEGKSRRVDCCGPESRSSGIERVSCFNISQRCH